jgi:hypothetical protein
LVALAVIHPNREGILSVLARMTVVLFVVVAFECVSSLIEETLGGVFDVVRPSDYEFFDGVPVVAFPVEAEDFVNDASCFELPGV